MISLILLACRAAIFLIVAAVVLSMIDRTLRPRWTCHPLVRLGMLPGLTLCLPFRLFMQRIGLPTRPLDFSPMLAILAIEGLQGVLHWLL